MQAQLWYGSGGGVHVVALRGGVTGAEGLDEAQRGSRRPQLAVHAVEHNVVLAPVLLGQLLQLRLDRI